MAESAKAEFAVGQILTFSGVLEAGIRVIDQYSRWEVLVNLQRHIGFLADPAVPFVLLLAGLILIHRSMQQKLIQAVQEASESRLHDSSGKPIVRKMEVPSVNVTLGVAVMGLLAAAVYCVIWLLSYNPVPNVLALRMAVPIICKTADCFPPRPNQRPRSTPPHQTQSCVGSNCVQGPNFAPLTLNQYGPPPVRITTSLDTRQPMPSPTGHPRASVKFYTDRVWDEGTFAVVCDRACHAYESPCELLGENPGSEFGVIPGQPNVAGFVFNRQFPPGFWCILSVESNDKDPVKILSVKTLAILDRTPK